ncbi:Os03g0805600, partial [Oryza sativa Japonica Group]
RRWRSPCRWRRSPSSGSSPSPSVVQRSAVVAAAVLCFAASRWLANFIEKNFYFQDYVHAYK